MGRCVGGDWAPGGEENTHHSNGRPDGALEAFQLDSLASSRDHQCGSLTAGALTSGWLASRAASQPPPHSGKPAR